MGLRRSGCGVSLGLLVLSACQAPQNGAGVPSMAASDAAFARKDYATVYAIARPHADAGETLAEKTMGILYLQGFGVTKDPAAAAGWFAKAAAQGDPDSQTILGTDYMNGYGVPQNDELALKWSLAAAKQGNASGERQVGFLYHTGRGAPVDYAEAVKWTAQAAEQGDGVALGNIGEEYLEGKGLPQDYRQALFWSTVGLQRVKAGTIPANNMLVQRDKAATHLSQTEAQEVRAEAASWAPTKGSLDSVRTAAGVAAVGRDGVAAQKIASGSGVVINKAGDIVTNHHVVATCGSIQVRLAGGAAVKAEIGASDRTNDLVVLKPVAPIGIPASFRDGKSIRQGDPVVLAGFPLNGLLTTDLNVTSGSVSALSGMKDDTRLLQFTAPLQSGNSGGPLLDQGGEVVGIAQSMLNGVALTVATGAVSQNANFAIKDSVVRTFLDSKGIAYLTAPEGRERKAADLSTDARRFTVFVECLR